MSKPNKQADALKAHTQEYRLPAESPLYTEFWHSPKDGGWVFEFKGGIPLAIFSSPELALKGVNDPRNASRDQLSRAVEELLAERQKNRPAGPIPPNPSPVIADTRPSSPALQATREAYRAAMAKTVDEDVRAERMSRVMAEIQQAAARGRDYVSIDRSYVQLDTQDLEALLAQGFELAAPVSTSDVIYISGWASSWSTAELYVIMGNWVRLLPGGKWGTR